MATKLFLSVDTTNRSANAGWQPYPFNPQSAPGQAAGELHLALTSQGVAGVQSAGSINTVAGPATVVCEYDISQPLAAGVTISGTITFNIWGQESNMSANIGPTCQVYRLNCVTGALTSIATATGASEFGTSSAVQSFTATPTSTAFNKGDRIVIATGFKDVGGTQAAGFTGQINVDGVTPAANGDSFVSFAETLTFSTSAPTGTVLYPTDTASDIDTADDDRLADFSRGGGSTTASVALGNGPISATQLQRSGTAVRWYSKQIAATTLVGPIGLNLRIWNSGGAETTTTIACKVFKRTAGGTETDLAYSPYANFTMAATDAAPFLEIILGIADTSLADGDRLGFIFYGDDNAARNVVASTVNLSYAGAVNAAGDTWLQVNSTLTEFVPGQVPYVSPMPQLLAQ